MAWKWVEDKVMAGAGAGAAGDPEQNRSLRRAPPAPPPPPPRVRHAGEDLGPRQEAGL